jgi:hypothetical protein
MGKIARSHSVERVIRAIVVLGVGFTVLLTAPSAPAYSVLTHEQVVDLLWADEIVPLLKKRFPQATDQNLREAHAYAYGGSMIQDMGYYPFGNRFFSDLLHYVRSGDFVMNLVDESVDLNQYAFALGALAHYASDNAGHPTVNHVVAIEFPNLRKKYGDVVTYADDPKAHIRTEFGFDMVQVAKNRYTSDRYHDFIGFEVSEHLLNRVFKKTYGLNIEDVIEDEDLAIGTFRWSVSQAIPGMTRVALLSRREAMVQEDPNFDQKKFLFNISRAKFEKRWGNEYRRPGFGARVLAFFLKIFPKVGPFKAVKFKIPTTQGEDLYLASVNRTVDRYREELQAVAEHRLRLKNLDCDTGNPTQPGEYTLSDTTYAKLIDKLDDQGFDQTPHDVQENILQYFSHADPKFSKRKEQNTWARARRKVELLQQEQSRAGTNE